MFDTQEFQQFLKALRCELYKDPTAPNRQRGPEERSQELAKNKQEAKRLIKSAIGNARIGRDGWIHHMLAKERYWLDLIDELLAAGHDPNIPDPDGLTALDLALKRDVELKWVEALLRAGATLGQAALDEGWWIAPRKNKTPEAFQRLLDLLGAHQRTLLQQKNKREQTALDWCLSMEEPPLEQIEALIRHGVRFSQARDVVGQALTRRPLVYRNLAWLRAMARGGLDQQHWDALPPKDRLGLRLIQSLTHDAAYTPPALIEAILHRDLTEALRLSQEGSLANSNLPDGTTPLMMALYPEPQMSVARELLSRGVDVNARRNDGLTALMFLASSPSMVYQIEATKALLQAGANINESEPRDEMTPLLFAIRDGDSVNKIKLLLEKGASLAPPRRDGLTAEDFANVAGKDLRSLLANATRQCSVIISQLTTSYRAEDNIHGELLFSSLFELGLVSFTVQAMWRPVGAQDWRSSHAEGASGSVELKANLKQLSPFALRAPAGPFTHEQGHIVNDWKLIVTITSPEGITLTQSGQSELTLSRGVDFSVGDIPERDKEIQRARLDRLTKKNQSDDHIFTHEDYQIRLTVERDAYQIGETLRGVVIIESKRDTSCKRHVIALQQYIIDRETGARIKATTLTPQIDFESPWYRERLAWPKESQTRCAFSLQLPMLTPSFSGRRLQVEWVVFFEADIPWALDPSVYKKISILPTREPPEETQENAPALLWPRSAWYPRKTSPQKRWEALGASLSMAPSAALANTRVALSLKLKPRHATQLSQIKVTLLGAEREEDEDRLQPLESGLWKQEERILCGPLSLSAEQSHAINEVVNIPPDAPASFVAAGYCFSWWLALALDIPGEEPLVVLLPFELLPIIGDGDPFRS